MRERMSSSMSMFGCEDGVAGGWCLSLYKVESVWGGRSRKIRKSGTLTPQKEWIKKVLNNVMDRTFNRIDI